MAKYINADDFVANLDTMRNPDSEFVTDDYVDGFSDGISAAIKELEAFPTVDVAPVRHGKWIYDNWCEFKCSECGEYSNSKPYKGKENFCPNCGAKMDGKEIE